MVVNPRLELPAFSRFVGGGGPIVPGPAYPFAFITIACGAISGFHALIALGTTPKMTCVVVILASAATRWAAAGRQKGIRSASAAVAKRLLDRLRDSVRHPSIPCRVRMQAVGRAHQLIGVLR
jgi:hypothetical protein